MSYPAVHPFAPVVPAPFLCGLDRGRQQLQAAAEHSRPGINEVLVEQGERLTHVYLLLSHTNASARRRVDGRERAERIYVAGDLIGAEALRGKRARHTVKLQMDSAFHVAVAAVPVAEMRKLMETEPSVTETISHLERGWQADAVLRQDAVRQDVRAAERLWRVAVRLIERSPGQRAGQLRAVSQEDLAALAGLSRQTANTILGEWRDLGRVETKRRRRELVFTHYHPQCPPYERPCAEPVRQPYPHGPALWGDRAVRLCRPR